MRRPAYLPAVSGFDDEPDEQGLVDVLDQDAAARASPDAVVDAIEPPDMSQFETPSASAPATDVVPQPPEAATPDYADEIAKERGDIERGAERDRMSRIIRGIELGSKQLTAGVLQQPRVADLVSPESTNYEGLARAAAEKGDAKRFTRGQAEIAAAHRRAMTERQLRLDEEARKKYLASEEYKKTKDEGEAEWRKLSLAEQNRRAKEANISRERAAALGAGKAGEKDIEGDVQKLAKETGDTAPLIAEKLARVKAIMAKHPDDLPGVGPLDSRKPAIALDNDAQSLQSDARELVNTLLFLQSGAGVTEKERENKYRAYGVGEGSTEEAFRQGMAKLENDMAKALRSKQAGFRPGVVDRYVERGGTSPEQIAPKQSTPSTGKPGSGEVIIVDAKTGEEFPVEAELAKKLIAAGKAKPK